MGELTDLARVEAPTSAIVVSDEVSYPSDRHPVITYLARLSPGSRPTMLNALSVISKMLVGDPKAIYRLPYDQLRYSHVTAIRSRLAETLITSSARAREKPGPGEPGGSMFPRSAPTPRRSAI